MPSGETFSVGDDCTGGTEEDALELKIVVPKDVVLRAVLRADVPSEGDFAMHSPKMMVTFNQGPTSGCLIRPPYQYHGQLLARLIAAELWLPHHAEAELA